VLGAIAQFEKTSLVAKLKAARDRKKVATGKCGGPGQAVSGTDPAHWSPVVRVVASQIPRSISSSEKNHALRFDGILKIEFARKSPSKGKKQANSIT
jgi:hypothetical protein